MHILVSNDDGYSAPGIQKLAHAMSNFGRVTVFAPECNQSGASNSLTLNKTLSVMQTAENVFVVKGTPSDCVHTALTGFLKDKPDLVVSGINCGANMGDDTLYSGTVAAAIEGYVFGIDSIAFSQIEKGWKNLDAAVDMACVVVERFLSRKTGTDPVLLNVNMPNLASDELEGIMATRLGRRHNAYPLILQPGTQQPAVYRLGAAGDPRDCGPGTDFWAVSHGFVSAAPLQIDLTAHNRVADAAKWHQ